MRHIKNIIIYLTTLIAILPVVAKESDTTKKMSRTAEEISAYLNKSYQYTQDKTTKDSALLYLEKAFSLFPDLKDDEEMSIAYNDFAHLYNNIWNYDIALECHYKNLENLDNVKKKKGESIEVLKKYDLIYWNIAACFTFEDTEKSKLYLKKDLEILDKIKAIDSTTVSLNDNYMGTYNFLGNMYFSAAQLDSAYYYYNKALSYDHLVNDKSTKSSVYNSIGIINWELGNYDISEKYFKKSFNMRKNSSIYFNLGRNHYLKKEYDKAENYLYKALEISKNEKNIENEYKTVSLLSKIYRTKKLYEQSLNMMDSAMILQDSIANMEKAQAGIAIEMQYMFKKQKTDLEAQIAEKERRMLIYILIITVLLLTIGVTLLLYRNQKMKAQKSKIEQENLELRNRQLQTDLEHKEKEKDMYAQYLLNHNEHIRSATEKVSKLKGGKEEVAEAMKEFESKIEKSVWNEFKMLFQNLHSDFYDNLYNAHPNLTLNEKKICVFIKLNMTSKEISAITGQQIRAIEVARTRLRIKLGLKRSDNLNAYLQQF